jgi:hypothetical protein
MNAVEAIINVQYLVYSFEDIVQSGRLKSVMDEIIAQSKVELNYDDDADEEDDSAEILFCEE